MVCLSLPASFHDVLVNYSVSEDFFVEELIGKEHQQRGNRLKQDVIGDVATEKKKQMHNESKRVHQEFQTLYAIIHSQK